MQFSLADRWIQSQLQVAIRDFRTALDTYRFDIAAGVLYEFIWNQFCDWYLELTKPVLTKGLRGRAARCPPHPRDRAGNPAASGAADHPFIAETIWKSVARWLAYADTIMIQAFRNSTPPGGRSRDGGSGGVKEFIVSIRNIRAPR